jgi:hypothetical protein
MNRHHHFHLVVLVMVLEIRAVISASELAVQPATELAVRPATKLAVRLAMELAVQPVTVCREANIQARLNRLPFSRMQQIRKDCSKTTTPRSFVAQHLAAK